MKKKLLIIGLALVVFAGAAGAVVLTPNPLGEGILKQARARGYLPYSADTAMDLAFTRCTACHSEEKILKYCSRCGPPFIVVIHFMKRYIEMSKERGLEIESFTDAEVSAITQAWNGIIGNWESDWPEKDIRKLLEEDTALIELLETPVKKRSIEMALQGQSAAGAYKRFDLDEKKLGKEKEPS